MDEFVINNRYEIIEKIGSGGMSTVYKAKDNVLNRFVAVKVLKNEFLNDEEFIKRFRSESLAYASLSHPNIVSIFDVGEYKGQYYIVMEYINGKTLKEIIKENKRLSSKDATTIAIQVCRALEHAHRKGIIHRDIKPQNILIDEDGIVKVADFGIARAVSTGTIINTNITIGSVHYFSPEQARGGFVDNKSDIYSLGVVLYEMVTGNLPFDGDTPISIALKHLQEEPKRPSYYNIDIPKSLENIIMKAMQKDQTQRYQTVSELMEDLKNSVVFPDGDFVKININDNDKTKTFSISASKNLPETKENNNGKNNKKALPIILGVFSALLIIGLAWLFIYLSFGKEVVGKNDTIELPSVVGMKSEDAQMMLEELGFKVVIEEKYDASEKGIVINQKPEALMKLKKNSEIKITVSKGPELIEVPDLSGMSLQDAEVELNNLGLNIKVNKDYNDAPADTVISQTPSAHELIEKNATVNVTVSKGPKIEKVKVPDVVGMRYYDAKSVFDKNGLFIGNVTYQEVEDKENDIVLSQSIQSGQEVEKGTRIDIVLSKKIVKDTTNDTKVIIKTILLPDNLDEANVKVVVVSDNTESVILDRRVTKDEVPLQVRVPITGTSTIKLYINDKLISEETMN